MGLEADIYSALFGATAAGVRVYPAPAAPGTATPYISWTRVSSSPVVSLSGGSGLDLVRVQVDCWADSRLSARALATEARAAMEAAAFKALLASDQDDRDVETGYNRVVQDFRLWARL